MVLKRFSVKFGGLLKATLISDVVVLAYATYDHEIVKVVLKVMLVISHN